MKLTEKLRDIIEMKKQIVLNLVLLLFANIALQLSAQQKQPLDFDFYEVQNDGTARGRLHKYDAEQELFAIIKVKSNYPDDKLEDYTIHFQQQYSENVPHDEKGERWLYVKRGAKLITIERDGYQSITGKPLGLTVESGHTYVLELKVKVSFQMISFSVQTKKGEPISGAAITINGGKKTLSTNEYGEASDFLSHGEYSYNVIAGGFRPTSGVFTLDGEETKKELITLLSSNIEITFHVDAEADICVNEKIFDKGEWTGELEIGKTYIVECRQNYHKSSRQYITIVEEQQYYELTPPTPITGSFIIKSSPNGATIFIDGIDYGKTPKVITNLLIGGHSLEIAMPDFEPYKTNIEVNEDKLDTIPEIKLKPIAPPVQIQDEAKYGSESSKKKKRAERKPMRDSEFFLGTAVHLGGVTALDGFVGGYVKGVFCECRVRYPFNAKRSLHYNLLQDDDSYSSSHALSVRSYYMIEGLAGYGFQFGERFRLTPCVGLRNTSITGVTTDGSLERQETYMLSGVGSVKAEFAILPFLSVVVSPDIAVPFTKNSFISLIESASPSVSRWYGGFGLNIGVHFNF